MPEINQPKTKRLHARLCRPFTCFLYLVCGICIFTTSVWWQANFRIHNLNKSIAKLVSAPIYTVGPMHLAVTVCGNRLQEGIVMLKSVTLLTQSPFHVHIFASDDLVSSITKELNSWPLSVRNNMNYTLLPVQFPEVPDIKVWKSLFRPCASQRLFLPLILKDVDAVVYVDSDVLFLRPLDDIWKLFNDFNETQIAALSPESEVPDGNWYLKHPKTPRVPPYGINTGVFLMSTTRMRQVEWFSNITSLYKIYKRVVILGDQDLVNIYFSLFPERLYLIPCQWNYRSDHCAFKSNCNSSMTTGVSLVHGNRAVFHKKTQPIFRALFQTLRDYRFDENPEKFFNKRMLEILLNGGETKCEKDARILLKQFHGSMTRLLKESNNTF